MVNCRQWTCVLFHPDNLRPFSFQHPDVVVAYGNINNVAIALRPDFMRARFNYFGT